MSESAVPRRHAPDRRQRISDAITRFSGSFLFLELHALWFAAWIILNLIPGTTFDAFPFGLLTLIVSLEAIFLSTFVLMSQNRSAERDEARARADLRVSVFTEVWAAEIGAKLGIDVEEVTRKAHQQLTDHGQF